MEDSLLGYEANLKPLTITQDAAVSAPRRTDTTVSTSPTDIGDRTWDTIGRAVVDASNLIGKVGNIYGSLEKERAIERRRQEAEDAKEKQKAYKAREDLVTNMFTRFDIGTTDIEINDSANGDRTDYNGRIGQYGKMFTTNFGSVGDDGSLKINRKLDIYKGLDADEQDALFRHITKQGLGTYKTLGKKKISNDITDSKNRLTNDIDTTATAALRANENVADYFAKLVSSENSPGLAAIGTDKDQVRDKGFETVTRALVRYKDDKAFLENFLKINGAVDEDTKNNASYQVMMATAYGYFTKKVSTSTKILNSNYDKFIKSGDGARLVPIIDKQRAGEELTPDETKFLNKWTQILGEIKGWDPSTVDGALAINNILHTDALQSKDHVAGLTANTLLTTGNLLPKGMFDGLSGDQKRNVQGNINSQVAGFIATLINPEADDLSKIEATDGLKHYSDFPGNTKFVLDNLNTYKSQYLANANPEEVAVLLRHMWTSLPTEVRELIPTTEQVDFTFAKFVADNPQFSSGYIELLQNDKGMNEALKYASTKASKEKANVSEQAGFYGLQAEEYFDKVYVLTQDVKKAKEATLLQYGMKKLGGIKVTAKIKDNLVGAGINSKALASQFSKKITEFVPEGSTNVSVIDLDGATTKIVYTLPNGKQDLLLINDSAIDREVKEIKDTHAKLKNAVDRKTRLQQYYNMWVWDGIDHED